MIRTTMAAAALLGCCQAAPAPADAEDPGCHEDEAAVVRPSRPGEDGLAWACVPLDDWADEGSLARLEALLAAP